MSMSRDRVRFTLPQRLITSRVRAAFMKAFGYSLSSAPVSVRHPRPDLVIVCRPSQFARFLIYRNEVGARNSFMELKPVLFNPEGEKALDVSANPNTPEKVDLPKFTNYPPDDDGGCDED